MASGLPKNRLGLAKWLVSGQHPLTARVLVNRIWQQYFGIGLVRTAEDFGVRGELPTHPELLDYLATELVDSKWDLKKLHRRIVLSATYRQSSSSSKTISMRAGCIRNTCVRRGGPSSPRQTAGRV